MHGATRGLGLLVVGLLLGRPLPVQAQGAMVKWADIVGTWEHVFDPALLIRERTQLYSRITFRPDSTTLVTEVYSMGEDTLSCSSEYKRSFLRADTLFGVPLAGSGAVVRLQDESLSLTGFVRAPFTEEWTRVYRRTEPSKQLFNQVISTGFASGRPMPAHTPPTGTLTDFVGAWAWEESNIGDSTGQDIKRTGVAIYRPDSTAVNVYHRFFPAEGGRLACGYIGAWNWKPLAGDTFTSGNGNKIVRQGSQFSIYAPDIQMTRTYHATDSLKKP